MDEIYISLNYTMNRLEVGKICNTLTAFSRSPQDMLTHFECEYDTVYTCHLVEDSIVTKSVCRFLDDDMAQGFFVDSVCRLSEFVSTHSVGNRDFCLEAVRKYTPLIKYISTKDRSAVVCLQALVCDVHMCSFVKQGLTREACRDIVVHSPIYICYIPFEYLTEELCIISVQSSGMNIKYIPVEYLTADVCIEAVKNTRQCLHLIPDNACTEDTLIEAIKSTPQNAEYLCGKAHLFTQKLCMLFVESDGEALRYLSDSQRTSRVCMQSVKSHPSSIQYLKPHQMSPRVCETAVKLLYSSIKYISVELHTRELCILSVQTYAESFEYFTGVEVDSIQIS
jgi:hypothetical protein